jgi:TrmH family RNA methyltransferase
MMKKSDARQWPPLPAAKGAFIRELARDKRVRDRESVFVLEGEKPVLELHRRNPAAVLTVVMTHDYLDRCEPVCRRVFERSPAPVYLCRQSVFEGLSDARTTQGILAVVAKPQWDEAAILSRPRRLGLYGDRLQDPTNVGVMIRTALAFGLDGLWLSRDSADVFNPKVVRGTAGALLLLPIFSAADPAALIGRGCALVAAVPSGRRSQPLHEITRLPPRALLAFGNESSGLSDEVLNRAALRFHIPVSPAVESLNVATAAAIAMYHFSGLKRQES